MVGGLIPVVGVADVGVVHVDFRLNGAGDEDEVEAGVLLLVGPVVGPEVAAGVFGEDISEEVLCVTPAHECGHGWGFTGVIHVAVENDAGIGISGEDGVAVGFGEAGFAKADFGFVEVLGGAL